MTRTAWTAALGFAAIVLGASRARAQTQPAAPGEQPTGRRVLALAEAERTALEHQPALLEARAQTQVSEAREDQTRAGLLPQVVGQASYSRQTGNFAPRPGLTFGPTVAPAWNLTTYNVWNFSITGSQLLWDFGQTTERHRAAESQTEAFRQSERTFAVQTVANVRKAYFAARAQKALLQVAGETLQNQEKHLAQIQGFVAVGTRPEIDLAQAKTDVANARVQLIAAENGYDVARAQLAAAMGDVDDQFDVGNETMPQLAEEDEPSAQLVARAMAARPELASLREQQHAQERTVRSYEGAYYPTLTANASATDSGIALDSLVPNFGIGATLTWPLFQGGITKGQVHEAEANVRYVQAQLESMKLQIRVDVEQARLAVRSAKAQLAASGEAVTNARDRLRLAEGRYASGVGSVIELSDAQVALTAAEAQQVQADYNLASARAQLLASLGRR